MPTRITLKAVNEELARKGFNATLAKGDGYFYFTSGEAADWLDNTVRVPTFSRLSLADWVGEFRRLRDLNGQIGKAPKKAKCELSVSLREGAYSISPGNGIGSESDEAKRPICKATTCPTSDSPSLLPQRDQRIHPQSPPRRNGMWMAQNPIGFGSLRSQFTGYLRLILLYGRSRSFSARQGSSSYIIRPQVSRPGPAFAIVPGHPFVANRTEPKTAGQWVRYIVVAVIALFLAWWMLRLYVL
jgi:hypothetical protein